MLEFTIFLDPNGVTFDQFDDFIFNSTLKKALEAPIEQIKSFDEYRRQSVIE